MDFQTAVRTCLARYADFTGRAPRSEFWWFYLAVLAGHMIIALLFGRSLFGSMLSALLALATILPLLAAGARRLHDGGRSGWFQLLGFIPLVNLYLIYLLASRGDEVANRYGPAPLALSHRSPGLS